MMKNHSVIQKNIDSLANKAPRSFNYISDVNEWLKKNRLDSQSRVYIVSSGYYQIGEALQRRGWIENPDYESCCFHLKFTLKGRDIDYGMLSDYQIVNHFEKATNITTKNGLCKTLKNCAWASSVDADSFYPKCFQTSQEGDFEEFVSYFKMVQAESILKRLISLGDLGQRDSEEYRTLLKDKIETAVKITKRRVMDVDDYLDGEGCTQDVTEREWEIISQGKETTLLRSKTVKKQVTRKGKRSRKQARKGAQEIERESSTSSEESEGDRPEKEREVSKLLKKLGRKYPQTDINGANSIWIVKPIGLSRGRGIELFNNLDEITKHVKNHSSHWVIQKYIENPVLFKQRKLDIRQWVLVTDWNPLTVWFYAECYIRITSSDYSLGDLKNKYVHLTNNSINKHSKNFEAEECFLSQDEFAQWLRGAGYDSPDPFYQLIQPKMKEITNSSLMAVEDMVENRKNSSELFGYDFCIDDKLNVWLIEINSSPAWDYSSVPAGLLRMSLKDW